MMPAILHSDTASDLDRRADLYAHACRDLSSLEDQLLASLEIESLRARARRLRMAEQFRKVTGQKAEGRAP